MRHSPSIHQSNGHVREATARAFGRDLVPAFMVVAVLCGTTGCSSPAASRDLASAEDGRSPDSGSSASAPVHANSPGAGSSDGGVVDASSRGANLGDVGSEANSSDVGLPNPDAADADSLADAPDDSSADAGPDDSSDDSSLDAGFAEDSSVDATSPTLPSDASFPDSGGPSAAPDSGGTTLPPPGPDGGPTTYAGLPAGPVNVSVSVQASGPVYRLTCPGNNCTIPTQQVVVSPSSVSPVSCSFAGTNPGAVIATCTLTVAYPYPSTCVVGDPGNCTWVVGLEPTWGPVSGPVASDGSFALTFGTPFAAQQPLGAVFSGQLLPIVGAAGTALGVSFTGYTGSDSSTLATGAAPLCESGSCGAICYVGGSAYASGYANPMTACQSCQPAVAAVDWSTSADGTSCGNGEVCASGTCGAQCIIGGALYAPGAANPGNVCQACSPVVSASAWSPVANGKSCGAGEVCAAGSCGGCTINGTTYAAGTVNPTSACQLCQPAMSTTQWSYLDNGTVCGASAGNNRMLCEYGTCSSLTPDNPNYCGGTPITTAQAQGFFSSGATTATIARYQTLGETMVCGPTDCSPWAVDTNNGPWLGVVASGSTSIWLPTGGNVVLTLSPSGAVSLSLVSDPVTTFGGTVQTTGYTQDFSPALGSGQPLVEQSFGGWPYAELYFKDLSGPGNQPGPVSVFMTDHCLQVLVDSAEVTMTDAGDDGWGAGVVFFATY